MSSILASSKSSYPPSFPTPGLDRQFGPKWYEMMQKTGARIAGSSVLQEFLQTEWKDSDIDMWVPTGQEKSVIAFLLSEGYQIPVRVRIEMHMDYTRLIHYIQKIYLMGPVPSSGRTLQLMVLNPTADVPKVVASFDITACQAWYDGRSGQFLTVDAQTAAQERRIELSDVALKLQSQFEWLRTLSRMFKYCRRGFTIPPSVWPQVAQAWTEIHDNLAHLWNQKVYEAESDWAELGDVPSFYLREANEYVFVRNNVGLVTLPRTESHASLLIKEGQWRASEFAHPYEAGEAVSVYVDTLPDQCLAVSTQATVPTQKPGYITFMVGPHNYCVPLISIQRIFGGTSLMPAYGTQEDLDRDVYEYPEPPTNPEVLQYIGGLRYTLVEDCFNMEVMALFREQELKYLERDELPPAPGTIWTLKDHERFRKLLPRIKEIARLCNNSKLCEQGTVDVTYGPFIRDVYKRFRFFTPETAGIQEKLRHLLRTYQRLEARVEGHQGSGSRMYIERPRTMIPERDQLIFYECQAEDSRRSVLEEVPYLDLRLEHRYLVPLTDVRMLLKQSLDFGQTIFRLERDRDDSGQYRRLKYTISHGVLKKSRSMISANHCQAKTDRDVYRIRVVKEGVPRQPVRANVVAPVPIRPYVANLPDPPRPPRYAALRQGQGGAVVPPAAPGGPEPEVPDNNRPPA